MNIIQRKSIIEVAVDKKYISKEVAQNIRYDLLEGRNPALTDRWEEYNNWDYFALEDDLNDIFETEIKCRNSFEKISNILVLRFLRSLNNVLISLQLKSIDLQYLIKEIEDLSVCNNGDDNDDHENNDVMVKNGDRISTFNDTISPLHDTVVSLISNPSSISDNNPINMLIKNCNIVKNQIFVVHNNDNDNDNKYYDSRDLVMIKESDIVNNQIHNNVEDFDAETLLLNEQQEGTINKCPVEIVDAKMKASLCNSVSDNYVENSNPENFLFNDKEKQGEIQASLSEMYNDSSIKKVSKMRNYRERCKNDRVWLRKEAEKTSKIRACRQKIVNKRGIYM